MHKQKKVKTSSGEISLPIIYRNTRAFIALFPAHAGKVRKILPSTLLRPVLLTPFTALIGIVVFKYTDTSIGPYNEIGVFFPVLYKFPMNVPVIPLFFEGKIKNFGAYIWHLPVTTEIAYNAGVEIWGYPKFLADITWEETPSLKTALREQGKTIFELEIPESARRARERIENTTITTFSVKDDHLLKTIINAQWRIRYSRLNSGAKLVFGDHPLAKEIESVIKIQRSLEIRVIEKMDSHLPPAEEEVPLR